MNKSSRATKKYFDVNEMDIIQQVIHNAIGWAQTKDFDLLFHSVAQDEDFFIFHPDSKSTIRGFNAFKDFATRAWSNPTFKGTHFETKDLQIHLSKSNEIAWFSCYLDDFVEVDGKESGWVDCRWTGVLEKRNGAWVHTQMHFSFPIDRER